MWNDISGKKLFKMLFLKFFTSDIINAIINIFLPVYISIRCTSYINNIKWWKGTITICITIVGFNIISVIAKANKNKVNKNLNIIYRCYSEHSVINEKFATRIYRLNKIINQYITYDNPINLNKKVFDKIADFQSFSFSICESIHDMLKHEYGDEINCEVTLMKKEENKIRMLSYSNDDNKMPSSYTQTFSVDDENFYFTTLFNDLNGKISCLPSKKYINENFKKLKGSEKREENICQYIGIPIKTNRNQIELLLQVDVSKEMVFGKTETEMQIFAKNVLYPYATLLHKSYERDLIFNQYYDMIVQILSKSNSRC